MTFDINSVWITLLLLGIFHGINPGMGWLFAVALGLQERRRAAVWTALVPLAVGHALAVGLAVLLAGIAGLVIPLASLKWVVAALLLAMGVFQLIRHRHPRFGGMQVGMRDLTIWSFLMASAHGAGLMVLPFLFGADATSPAAANQPAAQAAAAHASHAMSTHDHSVLESAGAGDLGAHADHMAAMLASIPEEPLFGLLATLGHTLGYLLAVGLVAVIVYEKLGLRLLQRAWVNLDLIWAGSLIATAGLMLLL